MRDKNLASGGDPIQRAALEIHWRTHPDCWSWHDCPHDEDKERIFDAARHVLTHTGPVWTRWMLTIPISVLVFSAFFTGLMLATLVDYLPQPAVDTAALVGLVVLGAGAALWWLVVLANTARTYLRNRKDRRALVEKGRRTSVQARDGQP